LNEGQHHKQSSGSSVKQKIRQGRAAESLIVEKREVDKAICIVNFDLEEESDRNEKHGGKKRNCRTQPTQRRALPNYNVQRDHSDDECDQAGPIERFSHRRLGLAPPSASEQEQTHGRNGSGLSPLFGGFVASTIGWRWIFWMSIAAPRAYRPKAYRALARLAVKVGFH
jgi:hypothetical protein